MYDEEKRKGSGTFYAVIGVATLVVAIIGATFAYFSASISSSGENISGEANTSFSGGKISLTVNKVKFDGASAGSINLVPADFGSGKTADNISTTEINAALHSKCENEGFTGCHIWQIVAKSDQDILKANINLTLTAGGAEAEEDTKWSYAVFKSTSSLTDDGGNTKKVSDASSFNADSVEDQGSFNSISGQAADIHQSNGITKGQDVTYYLMVFIENTGDNQLDKFSETKGSYTGTVVLDVSGTGNGQVKATFTSAG